MRTTEVDLENLVKLTQEELEKFTEGRPFRVNHPTKGVCIPDTRGVYINTFGNELTECEKRLFE
ncbi:hypothetical protein G1K72_11485 [Tenacibaculum finnmarkense]|uniref:hypothetical protein n=1 Tax=Tenacibaculum finnmarkense TaxID=2781243 RepID=UPI001EFA48A5|nr:hypothetical protein [Tenacibaculum finnmarkense]MCG8821415.1 hypothetical protein [Tenacibaculum finnmarkense]